jgi:lantibiotic modifying enzyme
MAKERTVQHGFGNNITYCHGDFGNLEILRFCAQVNDDAELRSQVDAASSALFRIYVDEYRHRSDCKHLYSNSLLVGTSGIGFALLRSIEEKRVPPLLWLTWPRRCSPSEQASGSDGPGGIQIGDEL